MKHVLQRLLAHLNFVVLHEQLLLWFKTILSNLSQIWIGLKNAGQIANLQGLAQVCEGDLVAFQVVSEEQNGIKLLIFRKVKNIMEVSLNDDGDLYVIV